ncbi:MAG: sulfite exporter TauE/SafE family protein [Methylococcaceae bacterium]|nr:sulfite exporter TauE/SafE family protein [Methylococcaceae bacterium]
MSLVIPLSLVIGLLLGLLGGGGSILTVPMLVYLLGIEPKSAIASSLVMVAVASLTAMIHHARVGCVCWKTGFLFGTAGMMGAYLGGRLAAFIPGGVLLILFAVIMLITAYAMLRGRRVVENPGPMPLCPLHLPLGPILFDGLLVGTITGLVGVGGGFVVVPALNLLGRLPMHAAVGTSLLVIAMNSCAALAGYAQHVEIDPLLVSVVTGMAIVGSLIGGMLSHRIAARSLRRGFGVFVIFVAAYLLYRELKPELVEQTWELARLHVEFLWGASSILALFSLYHLGNWIHHQGGKT